VVEHSLGKGEVESSIPSSSTSTQQGQFHGVLRRFAGTRTGDAFFSFAERRRRIAMLVECTRAVFGREAGAIAKDALAKRDDDRDPGAKSEAPRPGMEVTRVSEAVILRPAVQTDAPAIRELTRNAYAKWVPVIGREPKPMTADYVEAVRNHRIDLLYVDKTLAALIETIAESDHLLIENVAVAPRFQARGMGRKLMAHAEQVAQALGYGEVRLYTNKLFAENVQLYIRLGYRVDREAEFTGGIVIHMSKSV
jgi:ribosomal protein S18 acetylase RimI-like enzyme